MKELLQKLSTLRGVSGSEYRISDEITSFFKPYADEVFTDRLNNVIAVKRCGKENAPSIMLEAHTDEIGLMVSEIDKSGFVKFVSVGGIDGRILPGCEVVIHAKEDISGVIGAKPPHLQAKGDADNAVAFSDMAIDTGLSAEEVKGKVSVGDAVSLKSGFSELLSGRVSGKCLDDRAGIAVLLKTLELLDGKELNADIYAVAAVCEEVGGRGAAVAGYAIKPDIAIAVDVTHGITPDNSKRALEFGSGVAVAKGPNLHPFVTSRLIELADKGNIKYSIEVEGGDTGTDAWILQVSGTGIATALLSVPLRYMHTTVETIDTDDVYSAAKLIAEFCSSLDDDLEEYLCY